MGSDSNRKHAQPDLPAHHGGAPSEQGASARPAARKRGPTEHTPRPLRDRHWLLIARAKRVGMLTLELVAPALLLLVALTAFKACHRLETAPQLSEAQLRAALRLARSAARAGLAARAERPPNETTLGALIATQPVFVSIFGPGSQGRADPVVGRWLPSPEQPDLPLAQAIARAGANAGAALRARGERRLRSAVIKLDLAGPPRNLWLNASAYLNLVVDPGRDGLRARRGKTSAWALPSRLVQRGLGPNRLVRRLTKQLGEAAGSLQLARFLTTAVIEGPNGSTEVHRLVRGNVLAPEPTAETVRLALARAGRYLARSVRPNGTYCYEYDPLEDRCRPGYNLLRHAGTTYSLYQLYRELADPALLDAAERATEWLRRQVHAVEGDPSRAFLLEGDRAKLGAVGLTLIALVERERAVADGRDRQLLQQLAAFAMSQQRADGYFHSYYAFSPTVEVPRQNSIYYPGEALLGLVRLYGLDARPSYLETARKSADFLVNRRWRWAGVQLYVPPDAWLTQALAELDAIRPEDWLRDYAYRIVDVTEMAMLRAEEKAAPDLVGGPASGLALPRVTPAGSRIEGATAAWRMARRRGEREVAGRLRALSLRSAQFQLHQQYRPENMYFLRRPHRAIGGFRADPIHGEVRIDYVQHNCTALLGVLEMLQEAPP